MRISSKNDVFAIEKIFKKLEREEVRFFIVTELIRYIAFSLAFLCIYKFNFLV